MSKEKKPIQQEVLDYLAIGIKVSLNGRDIFSCDKGINSIKENTCYMREYIKNSEGDLEKINFTHIKTK